MSYLVLARKWRPQSFEDLVGQEHVSRTLGNAISANRVAHAFLFTGVRGVGKTTSARILAKALNCATGPTPTPCQKCSACTEIPEGQDVDVLEIDGASYNGVDEVRKLQESLPYRPARDRFKIYIVDEVHMLSNAAWNAFLKTLEEPPPHVKFIFATTEVHKVPLTILSRCQRYDFKLISARDIAARLKFVLAAEQIGAEDEAIGILAREAAGSMRDAMSLLDQVIAWCAGSKEKLSAEDVGRVLGVAARSVMHRLGAALLAGDAGGCVQIVADLAEQGYSLSNVAKDFLAHLRDLVVAKVCADPSALVSLADSELADLRALALQSDVDDLSRVYLGFSRAFDDIARSAQPRATLEMALVRLARRPLLLPLDELLERIGRLERRLGAPAPGAAAGPAGAGRSDDRGAMSRLGRPSSAAAPTEPRPAPTVPAKPHATMPSGVPAVREPAAEIARGAPPSGPAAEPARRDGVRRAPRESSPSPAGGESDEDADDGPAGPAPQPGPAVPGAGAGPVSEEAFAGWREILRMMAVERPGLASVFEHGAPLCIGPERIVIGYQAGSFLEKQAAEAAALELLRRKATEHFGCEVGIELDTSGAYAGVKTVAALASAERAARLEAARRRVMDRPIVRAALELLGAELREIRLPEGTG